MPTSVVSVVEAKEYFQKEAAPEVVAEPDVVPDDDDLDDLD